MAKRRKLEAPSAADLDKLEQEFRRETPGGAGMAPIAQVASESAKNMDVVGPDQRKAAAELDRFREAESRGLVAQEISLDDIDISALTRDRLKLEPEAFEELKGSIAKNGLRMPIEVYELGQGAQKRFGLISGYRRFLAVKELRGAAGGIEAFVRPARAESAMTEAMVEENEIRASLTQYERGRIAVLSAQNGHDADLEAAVNRLFGFASKAKRSKIRSFAAIYEALGDVLRFPEGLKERQGLVVAAALKDGHMTALREALAAGNPQGVTEEWNVIDRALAGLKEPVQKPVTAKGDQFETESGAVVSWSKSGKRSKIEIKGEITDDQSKHLISFVKDLL